LRILAQLARFHARRSLAAVHYNLYLQGKHPSELRAATRLEKDAVVAWRELVADAGDRYAFDLAMGARNHNLSEHWRDELLKLETDLHALETQCGSLSDASTKETVWTPIADGDHSPPVVEHDRGPGAGNARGRARVQSFPMLGAMALRSVGCLGSNDPRVADDMCTMPT